MLTSAQKNDLINIVGRDHTFEANEDLMAYSFDATAGLGKVLPDLVLQPADKEEVSRTQWQKGLERLGAWQGSGIPCA
jgi:hypothetical protein